MNASPGPKLVNSILRSILKYDCDVTFKYKSLCTSANSLQARVVVKKYKHNVKNLLICILEKNVYSVSI